MGFGLSVFLSMLLITNKRDVGPKAKVINQNLSPLENQVYFFFLTSPFSKHSSDRAFGPWQYTKEELMNST